MNIIYYDLHKGLHHEDGTPAKALAPCVGTIGFFDGVHKGHQFLIAQLVGRAKAEGREATVITFNEHPRRVLQSHYQPEMLNTLETKLRLLSRTAVDNVVVLCFSKEMAMLSARDFMQHVLCEQLNVKTLFVGYDHRFGYNRQETFEDYVQYGREMQMNVVRNTVFELHNVNISSTVIRSFLREGEVELAQECLGYPYTLIGRVVAGYHEGRKMGYPTANLDITSSDQMIPAPGVYAVKVRLEGDAEIRSGMMNIGTRPTFNGSQTTLETHIFNFDGDIYDQMLLVGFYHRIREEQKFDSPSHLALQLKKDEETARRLLAEDGQAQS